MNLAEVKQQHTIPGHIDFVYGRGGLPTAIIKNQFAYAEVSLYGAHVLKYEQKRQKDLLWMSDISLFEEGKPIRGGIPVCFPWFGPHVTDADKPQHGFGRLLTWNVLKTSLTEDETVQLHLGLSDSVYTKELWAYPFKAEMIIKVGTSLDVTLTYFNTGTETFICSDALHTYFNISDVANTKILGLSGVTYYKGFEKEATGKQTEQALQIQQEENRRYVNHPGECIIEDTGFNRKIHVSKTGSNVTVVWNPWENAKNIADIPDNGYKTMVCLEAVNAYSDVAIVAPGKSFSVSTKIWVE